MKHLINEIKRMQKLAGILSEIKKPVLVAIGKSFTVKNADPEKLPKGYKNIKVGDKIAVIDPNSPDPMKGGDSSNLAGPVYFTQETLTNGGYGLNNDDVIYLKGDDKIVP